MTKKSGDGRVSGLNEDSFQEKQIEITIVSRETKSPPPHDHPRLTVPPIPHSSFCPVLLTTSFSQPAT